MESQKSGVEAEVFGGHGLSHAQPPSPWIYYGYYGIRYIIYVLYQMCRKVTRQLLEDMRNIWSYWRLDYIDDQLHIFTYSIHMIIWYRYSHHKKRRECSKMPCFLFVSEKIPGLCKWLQAQLPLQRYEERGEALKVIFPKENRRDPLGNSWDPLFPVPTGRPMVDAKTLRPWCWKRCWKGEWRGGEAFL